MFKQPWIGKPASDVLFILLPPFVSVAVIFFFPSVFRNNDHLPDAYWVLLVLLIDVAHVYSTLYRTYFDRQMYTERKTLLLTIPFLSFIGAMLVYSISFTLFWRLLAYIAVFHFVRQQYGFMRVYERNDKLTKPDRTIDTIVIYFATLYPLIYWHLSGPKNFNWFLAGDFIFTSAQPLLDVFTILYWLIVLCYLGKEIYKIVLHRYINIPKTAVITGTLISWYVGIVYLNGDMAFTLLNVVSHGIPYIALIRITGGKKIRSEKQPSAIMKIVFGKGGIIIFVAILAVFAFIEEGLWDIFLWKEHGRIFQSFQLEKINFNEKFLSVIIPILTIPQLTHYILDGFIWRVKKNDLKF